MLLFVETLWLQLTSVGVYWHRWLLLCNPGSQCDVLLTCHVLCSVSW
jgi:hypothetical protein